MESHGICLRCSMWQDFIAFKHFSYLIRNTRPSHTTITTRELLLFFLLYLKWDWKREPTRNQQATQQSFILPFLFFPPPLITTD